MGTTWQRCATEAQENFCLRRLPDGSSGYELLHDVRARLRADFYPEEIVSFTVQHSWQHVFTLTDAFCFMRIWATYMTGKLCFFTIPVERGPGSDEDLEENANALKKLSDFETFVHNVPQDDDGHLEWSFELGCTRVALTDGREKRSRIWLAPRRVPLEIGSTLASRTVGHLVESRGVARWPYGSNRIIVGVADRSVFRIPDYAQEKTCCFPSDFQHSPCGSTVPVTPGTSACSTG